MSVVPVLFLCMGISLGVQTLMLCFVFVVVKAFVVLSALSVYVGYVRIGRTHALTKCNFMLVFSVSKRLITLSAWEAFLIICVTCLLYPRGQSFNPNTFASFE